MRNLFIFIVLITIALQLSAQHSGHDDHNLHGHVFYLDDLGKKKVLPYANVYWLSTNSGVISDSTGSFILHKPHNEEDLRIAVSFVGYNTDTLTVDHDQEHIEIILQEALALEEVTVVKNQATNVTSRINLMPTQIITEAGLQKLACCNIGESFESNATIDVGFTDAVSGAKKIMMLGLDGKYSQFMFENIPFMRGLESGYGLSHIPGPFMESIQVSKGTSSVLNGYESTTGQINVEYKKPNSPSDRENLSEFGSPAQKFPPLNGNILVKPKKTPKWIKIAIILLILLIIGGVLAFIFKDFLLDFVNDLL